MLRISEQEVTETRERLLSPRELQEEAGVPRHMRVRMERVGYLTPRITKHGHKIYTESDVLRAAQWKLSHGGKRRAR